MHRDLQAVRELGKGFSPGFSPDRVSPTHLEKRKEASVAGENDQRKSSWGQLRDPWGPAVQGFKGRGLNLEFYSTSCEKPLVIVPLEPVQFS